MSKPKTPTDPPTAPRLSEPIGNIDDAVQRALAHGRGDLADALTFMAIWESERVVKQARANPTWETCFGYSFRALLAKWPAAPTGTDAGVAELIRYGVVHRHEPSDPLYSHAPMPDGYWTPWHIAAAALAQQATQLQEKDEEIRRLLKAWDNCRTTHESQLTSLRAELQEAHASYRVLELQYARAVNASEEALADLCAELEITQEALAEVYPQLSEEARRALDEAKAQT